MSAYLSTRATTADTERGESVFAGVLRNASNTKQVGRFGGTLNSIVTKDTVLAAAVDLQLPG